MTSVSAHFAHHATEPAAWTDAAASALDAFSNSLPSPCVTDLTRHLHTTEGD
ncbi:MAG: hypothetical protein ABJB04_01700 [Betaproteobacteria bacterium]